MHIGRTKFKNEIITEFIPPRKKSSDKVIIFCSGLPSSPCKDDVLDFWARKGYWTFFPRYRGAWESEGVFLKKSPHEDILDVVDAITQPFVDLWSGEIFRVKSKTINIIGTSFGGPAALLASLDPRIHRVIGMSPVVDWQAEEKAESLDILYSFIQTAYGGAYRLNKSAWSKLAKGHFYNPVKLKKQMDPRKIMIFHAKDDDIVKYKPVAKFAKQIGCTFVDLPKGGHLSSSLLMKRQFDKKVDKFFTSEVT